jgi:hypothetical protein
MVSFRYIAANILYKYDNNAEFWKSEGKRPLGRPRHRWEDKIKMKLQEVECGGMDWIELTQDRDSWLALVKAVMKCRSP